MIKEHPFTTLCDLLRDPSQEVIDIFNAYALKPQSSHFGSNSQMIEMIVYPQRIENEDDAKKRIKDLMSNISDCGENYFAVFEKMSKVLTKDGMGKFVSLLTKNLSGKFLDDDNIQYLFKGMPVFKIKVVDNKIEYWRQDKTVGKYDITFVHTGKGNGKPDDKPIKFQTIARKALYLFFLLIPGKKIMDINKIKAVFTKIIENSFDYNMNIFDSINKDFRELITNTKPYTNSDVKEALNDRDDDNWYIIDYERHTPQYYSLSLPEEMIDISGCPELLEFKKELLRTIK